MIGRQPLVHLRSMDVLATEHDERITIARRPALFLLLAALCAAMLGGTQLLSGPERAGMARILTAVFGLLGGFMLLLAGLTLRQRSFFDLRRGLLHYGAQVIPFSRIGGLAAERNQIGDVESWSIVVQLDGRKHYLVNGQLAAHRDAVERLVARLREVVATAPAASPREPDDAARAARLQHRFYGTLLVGGGALIGVAGYFIAPEAILAAHGSRVLFWPLGIWIAAPGALELAGVPAWRWLSEGPRRRRVVATALWMGSYLALFHR